jgi:DNA-binding MarR family transcriptional regulator
MAFLDKYIALLISKGVRSPKELAAILNVSERDMRIKLSEMEEKGLIECSTKGFWIFKKTVCRLKDKGFELAEEAWRELTERRKRLEGRLASVDGGRRDQVLRELVREDPVLLHVIPLMLWFNLIPAMLIPTFLLNELLLNEHLLEDMDINDEYLM